MERLSRDSTVSDGSLLTVSDIYTIVWYHMLKTRLRDSRVMSCSPKDTELFIFSILG